MAWWTKLLGRESALPASPAPALTLADERFATFLLGWTFELRAGKSTDDEILEAAPERFFEHFPATFDAETEGRLVDELGAWTRRFLAAELSAERTWSGPTANDRLTLAFEALRADGLVALEDAGVTIQDGWGGVGLAQREGDRGAVFFHQQDIADALRGEELLLAFGAFEEEQSQLVGRDVVAALTAHGLATSWSGLALERIRLAPFAWRKRRWTQSPTVPLVADRPPDPAVAAEVLATPRALAPESLAPFVQAVTAVRSSRGFNLALGDTYRALWKKHGGVRGQMCHVGPPHVFVPAGQQTEMAVRNAHENLAPAEATSLRLRALRAKKASQRAKAFRAPPWERPRWTAGGAPARLGFLVLSVHPLPEPTAESSPVDLPDWCPYPELLPGLVVVSRERAAEPERFERMAQAAELASTGTSTGPSPALVATVREAQYGAMVQCEVADPSDLGYLQGAWAVVRWLLERGPAVVLDIEAQRWWSREEVIGWHHAGWPTGRRFSIEREVSFINGPASVEPLWWLGTLGLSKFGRPDVLCFVPSAPLEGNGEFVRGSIPGYGPEAVNQFATRSALGERFSPGDDFQVGSLSFTVEACQPGRNAPAEASPDLLVLIDRSSRGG